MINALSRKLSLFLINHNLSKADDYDLLEYGLFLTLSHILYAIVSLLCGILFHCILQSVIFFIAFSVIRVFSGGFHASSEFRCFISSAMFILISVFAIRALTVNNFDLIVIIVAAVSSLIIFFFSPVDTASKSLDDDDRKRIKKCARLVLTVFIIIIAITFCFIKWLCYPIIVSVILESILLLLGKLDKISTQLSSQ